MMDSLPPMNPTDDSPPPYGLYQSEPTDDPRPATLREWYQDNFRQDEDKRIVGGPSHTGGPDCPACLTMKEFIRKHTQKQVNAHSYDEIGAARVIFKAHTRVEMPDGTFNDEMLNVCDCRYCYLFRSFLTFRLYAFLERQDSVEEMLEAAFKESPFAEMGEGDGIIDDTRHDPRTGMFL